MLKSLPLVAILFIAAAALADPAATQPAQFRVQSIVTGPQPKAMINGAVVGESSMIQGYRVLKIEARRLIVERDGKRFVATMDSTRLEPYRPPAPTTKPASTRPSLRIDGASEQSYKNSLAAMRASMSREERGVLDFSMDKILLVHAGVMKAAMIDAYRNEGKSPLQMSPLEKARIDQDAMTDAAEMMRDTLNGKTAEEIAKLGGSCYRLLLEQEQGK